MFKIRLFSHKKTQNVQKAFFVFLCLFVAVFTTTQAQKPAPPAEPHDHSHLSNTAESSSPAQKYFTDVELINQDGKKVHFYSDVLKGKTVIVNAFFTSCTSVCPPMNRNMEKIQEALGDASAVTFSSYR